MYPVNKRPPSYPISSKSRSKLNNFRYNDQDETSSEKPSLKPQAGSEHTDKENQSSWLNGVVAPAQPELDQRPSSSGAAESKVVKECPQTPGNRIPLADLIGNVEDAINQAPGQEYTPEDYVIWQHVPASSNTGTMSQTPATNKKKRRRNSSPGSSPLAGNSKSARKGSFDLQSFQAVLKTPQNDIAADLWNNYVGKATANGNGEIPQIRFQNLLSSSPQTPATGRTSRDSSGLRRATSCNVEWPSSKAKRRKLDFSRSKSNVIDAGTSSSNINRLMERIEKSLRKTPMPQADSSPVPKREEVRRSRSTSPVERKQPLKDLGSPGQETKTGDSCIRPIATEPVKVSSSDFGDDDLDQDFLDLAEAAMDPFVDSDGVNDDEQVAKPNGLPHLSPVKAPAASGGQVNSHVDTTMAEKSDYKYDADEFDDDFEEFSDNIEDILAECDGTPSTKLARSVSNNNPVSQPLSSGHDAKPLFAVAADQVFGDVKNPEATSSGDEFDDEDFDMEAIEQSMKQTAEEI
ncbi:bifunctional ATP-dependent DNA helicase/ssDNA endodeoxyribonuclease DNA2 [Aspergillus candidus]|uniref:Uncharacterized protein n=1 Tax=Aspergillus candidus TaxID=41067 RepID=A0A2I2FPE1_ASPCN|nr:hypothetical protein BDW47DRAFT_1410 [Aspergillus candidus]PLB42499.1 hypothetical protein BDW47DRAFT_1410 [Aspergillus candidus]